MSVVNEKANLERGKRMIEWVSKHMKVLNGIRERFVREKPLEGVKISASLHLEAKTAYLVKVLRDGGAFLTVVGANPYSTKDDVALALSKEENVEVYAIEGEEGVPILKELRRKALEISPNLIIDDGAELTELLLDTKRRDDFYGVSEETTSGVMRLKEWDELGKLWFPVVPVNDAYMKHLFDNRYGTGQSTWDGIMRATNLSIAGKRVLVIGYGWCGKGIAQKAVGLGAKVMVYDVDPIKMAEAHMEGYEMVELEEGVSKADIIITATGARDVLRKEQFEVMKDGVIIANAGHFSYEINLKDLKDLTEEVTVIKDETLEEYKLKNNKSVYLLCRGNLVNISAGDGHPVEIMDLSFSLQALSVLYLHQNRGNLPSGVMEFPRKLDLEVAKLYLKSIR